MEMFDMERDFSKRTLLFYFKLDTRGFKKQISFISIGLPRTQAIVFENTENNEQLFTK